MHGGGRRGGRTLRERPRLRPAAQEIVRRRGAEREEERRSGEGVWVLVLPLADEKSWRWRGAGVWSLLGRGEARRVKIKTKRSCFGGERFYKHALGKK